MKVYLDGNELPFDTVSQPDSWTISFGYQHSSHVVSIDLNVDSSTLTFADELWKLFPYIFLTSIAVVVTAVLTFLISNRKRRQEKKQD